MQRRVPRVTLSPSLLFSLPGFCHKQQASGCRPCVSAADCGAAVCAQLGGDSFCVDPCDANGGCAGGLSCTPVVDVGGAQASVCVDPMSECADATGTIDGGTTSA